MNNVSLMGRLTRDPEVRYSANTQLANARFSVAVDRRLSKEKRMEAETTINQLRILSIALLLEGLQKLLDNISIKEIELRLQVTFKRDLMKTNKDKEFIQLM